MKFIVGKRGSGKTTYLMKECSKTNGYIICSHIMVGIIHERAKIMNLKINKPISYNQFINGKLRRDGIKRGPIYIDNVDAFLSYISSLPIEAVTLDEDVVENLMNEVIMDAKS